MNSLVWHLWEIKSQSRGRFPIGSYPEFDEVFSRQWAVVSACRLPTLVVQVDAAWEAASI